MNLRSWLKRLLEVEGNAGLSFLHSFFRRSPRDPVDEKPKPDDQPVFDLITSKDDYRIRLGATCNLVTNVPYSEVIADLSQLRASTTEEVRNNAIERLSRLQQEGPIQFPLDIYWLAIGSELLQADEWLHYGTGSRKSALDLFLPASQAASGKPEEIFNFSLHCTSESPFL